MKIDLMSLACGDSVDFRLLFTCPPTACEAMEEEMRARELDIYKIGHVEDYDGNCRVYIASNSRREPLVALEKVM